MTEAQMARCNTVNFQAVGLAHEGLFYCSTAQEVGQRPSIGPECAASTLVGGSAFVGVVTVMACHHSAHTDGSPAEGMGTERVYASGLAVPSLEVRVQGPAQRDRDQICRVDSRAARFDMGIVRA